MRAGRPRSQVIRDGMRAGRPRSQEMRITTPLRGSRRSRAVRRRLMRWGGSLGLGQERFKARDCSWMEANSWRFSDSLGVCR